MDPETPSERTRLALVALPAVLVGATFGMGKIVRDCSLTCNVGYELAPLGILAVAVAALPFSAARARLESRWGYARWQVRSSLFAAATFLLFRLLTFVLLERQSADWAAGGDGLAAAGLLRWIYLAFFVWLGAVTMVLGGNLFGHVQELFAAEERERAVGRVAVAVLAGATIGSYLAGRGAALVMAQLHWRYEMVRDTLLVAMGIALVLTVPAVRAIARRRRPEEAAAAAASPSLSRALRLIQGDATLRRLSILPLVGGVATSVVTYLFYWVVTEQYRPDASTGRTLYFATFHVWLSGVSLVLLAFGTGRLIRRLGLSFALLSLPIALFLGAGSLALTGMLAVIYVVRVVEAAIFTSLYEPGVGRLLLQVDEERSRLVRPVLAGLVGRVGEGAGAILVLVLSFGLHVTLKEMLAVYVALLLAWMAAIVALRAAGRGAASAWPSAAGAAG